MKKLILLLCFSVFAFQYSYAQGVWTWVKGDTTQGSSAVHGIQGLPDSANTPAGLYEPCEWTDLQGNFWLFGGLSGYDYQCGDLWKYDPLTNNWTWMKGTGTKNSIGNYGIKGVAADSNLPPARAWGAATWVDLNGNLWLYGGQGHTGGFSDLWKYNIASNRWIWVQGDSGYGAFPNYGTEGISSPTNTPGYRWECSADWADMNGNFWLYGGYNIVEESFNDLWKYDISTNEWTWMNGSNNTFNNPPVYGTLGTPDPANTPGSRWAYCSWKDLNNKFWFFGGGDFDNVNTTCFNDMWKYDPSINEWTWMSGSNQLDNPGYYGTICNSSASFAPSGRFENRARWTDGCGKFWMYGGYGADTTAIYLYSDLWSFDPVTLQWTLASGSAGIDINPVYGSIGVPSASNQPGGRGGSVAWKGNDGTLYLFGGSYCNDLWAFKPDSNCPIGSGMGATINLGNDTVYCSAFSRVLSTKYANTIWSTGDTALQITVTSPGKYWATVNGFCRMVGDTINISMLSPPISGILNSSRDSICVGTGVVSQLTDTGSIGQIQWQSSSNGNNFSVISGDTTTTYSTPRLLAQTTYYRARAINSCGSDSSNVVIVHVLPAPTVNFKYSINGKQISFKADSVFGDVVSYHWDFGDSQMSNDSNPVHTFDSSKTYYVCLTVYNRSNCSFTNCEYVNLLSTGIKNSSATSSLLLYPNPANNELTIEVLNGGAPKQISITDNLGRTLIQLNTYKTKTLVDIHTLAAGIYFVKTQLSNGSVQVRKLVKE